MSDNRQAYAHFLSAIRRLCYLLPWLLLLPGRQVSAQRYLRILPGARQKAPSELTVRVIDKRSDPGERIGNMIIDPRNGWEELCTPVPLTQELGSFFKGSLRGQTGSLLLLLRRFEVRDFPPKDFDAKPYACFSYSADYFHAEKDGSYKLLGTVDTQIWVISYNVHKKLFAAIGQTLAGTYEPLLRNRYRQSLTFSAGDIQLLDTNWRQEYSPFTGPLPKQAYYNSWNDFLLQRADTSVSASVKNNTVCFFRKRPGKKPQRALRLKGAVFALDGVYYYRMKHSYRRMERIGSDFWVKAPVYLLRYRNTTAFTASVYMSFGLTAIIRPFFDYYEAGYYHCKVNPGSGELVPVTPLAEKPHKDTYLSIQ